MHSQDILDYWFTEQMRPHWFASTEEIDARIRDRFEATWAAASQGELDDWQASATGALALIIVLDQFPLNMFRGEAKSFATEGQAIQVSKASLERGHDRELNGERLAFLLMPLMHSEKLADQDLSVRMYAKYKLQHNLRFAEHHREIVRRFGRFPHRNAILGRHSTPEELAYLDSKEAFRG